ncbi:MAG: type 4a pilus biogenesis protein PilO [Planctomycetota bacterium]|nr:type 4a pilus biogenesis protein PilO [Planctomycetota bacterium]
MHNNTRQAIFFAILLAVPLGAWAFVFHPRNQAIAAARSDVDLKVSQLQELREVESINASLEVTLGSLQSALHDLRARIPDAAGVEDVLRRIAEIAQQNELVIRSFKRQEAVDSAHYTEMSLETVIEGPFSGVHQFLFDLEGMPRITRILDMTIEKPARMVRGSNQIPPGHVRSEMTITIYAEPEKESS